MNMMNDIRSDIRKNEDAITEQVKTFKEDMISRLDGLQIDVVRLNQRLDTVERRLSDLVTHSTNADGQLNTITDSLTTANRALTNLDQRLTKIDGHCTQLDTISRILTATGVPDALGNILTPITSGVAEIGRKLNNVVQSLITANGAVSEQSTIGRLLYIIDRSLKFNGNPIDLNQRLAEINGRFDNENPGLGAIRQAITTANGRLEDLGRHIDTVEENTGIGLTLLNTVHRSLILESGEPINMIARLNSLDDISRDLESANTQLAGISRSVIDGDDESFVLHAQMRELRLELRAG